MNVFNQQILAAKKKQRQLYFKVFGLFITGAIIVLVTILASQGTRIEILPQEAAESSSIQRHKGFAVIIADTLYSISNKPEIAISAEGFHPTLHRLSPSDFSKVISITLKPLSARLELNTPINDDKTSWLINDAVINTSAMFNHELVAGDYKLTVTHPYYNDASIALSLTRGELFKKTISLFPLNGQLTINTKPQGARIVIDGEDRGLSPIEIPLLGGAHPLQILLDGCQTISTSVEVNRNNLTLSKKYTLERKQAALSITLNPLGGRLVLDKKRIKTSPKTPISKGIKHTLSYSKQGYYSQSKSITLDKDELVPFVFNLKKEMGKVEINTTPIANVKVNGQPMGLTPLHLSLQAVKQTITLQKQGFAGITKQITPSAKSTQKINVTLINDKLDRYRKKPKFYTHKAGGQLRLFTPNDSFTMGASRSEQGQRANEFLKTITLNKAFYAGVTEVTINEYQQYDKRKTGIALEPVTSISWIEAAGFCNWLSQKEALPPVYRLNGKQLTGINKNAHGYRLLTEAEWEWLARKSAKSAQTLFVWGNEYVIPKNAVNIADESANGSVRTFVPHYNDGFASIAPIKSFKQEKSGLYDLGGNVSEWTHTHYSIALPKSSQILTNPFDLTIGQAHVVKGANWRSGSITELRPAFREGLVKPRDDLGFRIGRYVYRGN